MTQSVETQRDRIEKWLLTGMGITAMIALNKFGTFRLASHIYALKRRGHNIKSQLIELHGGRRFAEYWI